MRRSIEQYSTKPSEKSSRGQASNREQEEKDNFDKKLVDELNKTRPNRGIRTLRKRHKGMLTEYYEGILDAQERKLDQLEQGMRDMSKAVSRLNRNKDYTHTYAGGSRNHLISSDSYPTLGPSWDDVDSQKQLPFEPLTTAEDTRVWGSYTSEQYLELDDQSHNPEFNADFSFTDQQPEDVNMLNTLGYYDSLGNWHSY